MASLELRPVRVDDRDAICELATRAQLHDGMPHALTRAELDTDLSADWLDTELDTRLALEDGVPVGWCWVWNAPSEVRLERAFLFGAVDPAQRGRGIGRELLAWALDRATERLRGRPHDLPRVIRVECEADAHDTPRLFARFGFRPVRWFEELGRPLVDLPDVRVPDAISIVPWPDGRDNAILAMRNDAFADHWGSAPIAADDWHEQVHGHAALRALSAVACTQDGVVVASCLNHAYPDDDALTGRREAWIHNLATLREWRGHGIASALIGWSLHAFAASGFDHAMIGVDADSLTGAARLYRSLGFQLEHRRATYEVAVT